MTEWFKVLVLKTSVGQLTASSNLALSATDIVQLLLLLLASRLERVRSRATEATKEAAALIGQVAHC